ncbi:MAG: primosomal protein N' [Rubricoccaceae bacterium]|nr:primosomal protein N' [Rubricoccaceae bacterium]
MPYLAEIAPLAPVEGPFSYLVPDSMAVVKGSRVVVPFGGRRVMGVVLESRSGDTDGLKAVEKLLDDQPVFTDELLGLTEWIADYYLCSRGEVLKAVLPRGLIWTQRKRASTAVKARLVKHLQIVEGINLEAALAELRGARQRALLETVACAGGPLVQAEALQRVGASSATAKSLVDKGLLKICEIEVERRSDEFAGAVDPPRMVDLHASQKKAVTSITDAIENASHRTFLLHGVTGSGKTEVYIHALKETLERGKTAIILVPEIALTPQTVRRFRTHFGRKVAVLHSRMSDGERFDAWRAIRAGKYPIVIGPRSAVLAPLANIGLIVVDEEHETSYKQFDPAPRYHARDVAVMRAFQNDGVCVLGSATPSLESAANAQHGKYTLLKMPDRVPVQGHDAAPLPDVHVVNLAREKEIQRLKGALSDRLRDAVQKRLERDEQVILLQNRRGYSPVLTCDACGFTPACRDCAVSLTVHKARRQLRCHYCGLAERQPDRCPACGSGDLVFLGTGTQRIEEELAELFPEARVLRMDLDTTSRKGAHRQILERFGSGDADILLGTQMVAKGLDFPGVTLVGVVNADTGMLMPDFRAAERTFQLLAQVAGRAGRKDLPGEVVLQTRNPDHAAVQFALTHDYEGFARKELSERRVLGYPPFGRMIGVEFKGPEERGVSLLAQDWTNELAKGLSGVEVLGPTSALVGRVKKQWRYHTILKAPRSIPAPQIARFVREANSRFGAPKKGYRINIDVDPVGLY